MRIAYKRDDGRALLKELEKERGARLRLEGQLEEAIKMIEEIRKENEALRKEIAKRDEEIERLKSQINKDSSNSSKPPSSNGFKKIPNNRERSGKKHGGQEGHKGATLVIPKNLEELVSSGKAEHNVLYKVTEGESCVSDWLIDVKVITVYTEVRRAVGAPPKIEYGNSVKALTVYLSVVGLIAVKRLAEFFHEVSGGLLVVSKSTLQKFTHEGAQNAELEPYITDLLNGSVMGVDETPVRTTERENIDGTIEKSEKTTLTAYIRTYSNARTTVLTPNAHKNTESVEHDNILTRYFGVVIQDFEAKFLRYGTATGLCGAHLSRELKGLAQLEQITWANNVRQFFRRMNLHKITDVRDGVSQCDPDALRHFETEYEELVLNGQAYLATLKSKSYTFKILSPMVNRLSERKSEYLLFMRNYEVPFTNNLSERDLRHCKIKQKVSGCFRSWQGLVDYCILRSVLETARKRGQSLLFATAALFSFSVIPAGQ